MSVLRLKKNFATGGKKGGKNKNLLYNFATEI